MRTSYSALQTYKQCPQKYKFQEIDRIPSKKSKEAIFGTVIHGVLKFMFSKDPLFPTIDEVADFYRNSFSSADPAVFGDDVSRANYFKEGLKMLKNFYAKNAPWNYSVVDLESRFEVPLADDKTGQFHILSGKIDRIDKSDDESYEIIDYKTGKRMPSQAEVDSDLQLSLYALGLQKKWPHLGSSRIKVSLYFLKHGEKLTSSRGSEAAEKVKAEVVEIISEINKKLADQENFEPLPSPLCDYCSYKPICPAWRHLYRKTQNTNYKLQTDEMEKIIKYYFELKKSVQGEEEKIAELQKQIKDYMEQENLTRVFGNEGYISKSVQVRRAYHFDKIREILEPIGRWPEILEADEKKLKKIMASLPQEIQDKIKELGIETREFIALKVSMKKIKKPEETNSSDRGGQ